MSYALDALDRMLILMLIEFGILTVIFILSILHATKSSKTPVLMFAIGIFLIVSIFASFVPFVKDYSSKEIVVQEGMYINVLEDISKSSSGILGINSVTLTTDDGKVNLTTIPHSDDEFPQGEFSVTAYYTKNSKWLLYIEVRNS